MRIAKLDLARYGHFTDRTLRFPAGDLDLHIVLGANEAGKSTARSAIADLLYGIPHSSSMDFLHPGSDMLIGAEIDGGGGSLALERRKKRKDPLTRATGEVVTDMEMSALLAGIDRDGFARMFCMDLDGLRVGARDMLAAKDDVSQLLFGSASGLPGLSSIRAELKASIGRLYTPRKSTAELHAAAEAYRQADKACQEASLKLAEHKRLGREVDEAVEAYEAATLLARQAMDTLSALRRIRRTAGLLMRLDAVRRDLAEHTDAPILPEDADKTYRDAVIGISEAATRRRLAEERKAFVDAALKALPPTSHISTVAEQIQSSLDEVRAVASFGQDIAAARVEAETAAKAALRQAAALGWQAEGVAQISAILPSKPSRIALKAAARSLIEAVSGSKTAKLQLAECSDALEAAQARLAEAPRLDVSPSLRAALNAARSAQSDYRDADRYKADLTQLVEEGKSACASLAPGEWTSDALDSLLLPSPAHAQSVDTQVRDYERAIAAAEDAADSADRSLSGIAAQIESASGGAGVTLEAVRQARDARDDVVRTALAAGDLAAAEVILPTRIVEADRLADDRFSSSTESLRIDALLAKREDATAALADARAAKVSAQGARASAIRNWQDNLPDARLRDIPLSQYGAWHAKATSIIALRAKARSTAAAAEACLIRGEAARTALAAEILGLGPSSASEVDIGPMIEWVDQFISKRDSSAARAEERAEQLAAAEVRHRKAVEVAAHADTVLGDARIGWRAALSTVSLPESVGPEAADELLTDIESIDGLLSNVQRITGERIEGPQAHMNRVHAQFATLVGEHFPELAGIPIGSAAQSIATSLREAVQSERDRLRLRGELSAAAGEAAAAIAAEELARSAVTPLMRDAGVDSIEALPASIDRASEVRRLKSTQETLLNDIAAQSDGLTEDQLREAARSIDAGQLDGLISEAEERSSAANTAVEAAVERKTQLTERQLVGAGSDAAAIAASDREAAKARVEEAGSALVELMIQDALLKRGMDDFRERNQGPMLARARKLFPQLTRGAYIDLCIDQSNDVPVLQGLSAAGARVEVSGMSEGTRDQLFMALRLSALQLRVETGGALPFIADDLFMAFDDSRAEACFTVLSEMAQRQQVIYFTHHEHLVDVARRALGGSVSVIDLSAAAD